MGFKLITLNIATFLSDFCELIKGSEYLEYAFYGLDLSVS